MSIQSIVKKINIFLFFCLGFAVTVKAQTALNLLGNLNYDGVSTVSNQELSDVWGYATWGNYAYVTNESANGLEIIDLSNLPTTATSTNWTGGVLQGTATNVNFTQAHNIYIDENGFGYIFGANYGVGGTIIINIAANPTNPPIVGLYNQRYCHDGFVRNDILYSAEINNGIFSIVDVSNKSNPVVLGNSSTTNNFTHNVWPSDNGNYLFTTDEVSGAEIGAYDISDFTDIQRVDGIKSNPNSGVIVHNTHVLNDFLVTSYYRDGVTIVDANCPDILVEVANYDTSPQFSGNGFNGCWGVYPFLPSGNIIASDIENGLYILDNNYVGASYLIGNVTDENGNPMNNVNITVSGIPQGFTTTDFTGDYKTGIPGSGTFQVVYSVPGFSPIAANVTFVQGVKTVQNIQFVSNNVTVSGKISNLSNLVSIFNAQIIFSNPTGNLTTTSDFIGNYSIDVVNGETYDIFIGKWGFISKGFSSQTFTSNTVADYFLEPGYCDDFVFDFNWQTSDDGVSSGLWTLGEPVGTNASGIPSNPDFDITSDLGDQCYVTGNGGGSAGTDDIDGGSVTLTSPTFDLSNYANPLLTFNRWFFMAGGGSTPDDTLTFEIISNGLATTLNTIVDGDAGESSWVVDSFYLSGLVPLSNNMQFRVIAEDNGGGHLSEAALDGFCIVDEIVNICPSSLTINAVVSAGTYNADDFIFSDGKVNAASLGTVTFNAGFYNNEYIELQNGFEADGSVNFIAENIQCDFTD